MSLICKSMIYRPVSELLLCLLFLKIISSKSSACQATVTLILQNCVYLILLSLEHFPKACVKPVITSDYSYTSQWPFIIIIIINLLDLVSEWNHIGT